MTQNLAAGLLMCRISGGVLQYFLAHPGGPFFINRDAGVWTIPKGVPEKDEELLETARREFLEETGITPSPPFHYLGTVKQKGGKVVEAWTFLGTWDPHDGITCNHFTIEWPPRSGRMASFPEMNTARWMDFSDAVKLVNPAQIPLLERAREIYHQIPRPQE